MSGFIKDLMVKYLSEYCYVDEKDISLSVFSGKGTLEKLVLKPEAFTPFDLPVSISRAVVGHIDFEIPWTSLKSSPCVARVSDIHICVTPPPTNLSQKEKEERLERARERLLSAFEDSRKAAFAMVKLQKEKKSGGDGGGDDEDDSFTSRLTEIIINNLIVEVSNVHLRYECHHSETSGIPHTVAGFTLSGVKLQSCDSTGKPVFIDPTTTTTVYKHLSLSGLRLYSEVDSCHEETKLASEVASDEFEWDKIMKRQLDDQDSLTQSSCIFGPVQGGAQVTLVQKKHILKHKEIPRVSVSLSITNVAASWSRRQYLCVVRAAIEMSEATARLQKLVAPNQHEELWDEYEFLYHKVVFHTATGPDNDRIEEITKIMPGEAIVRSRKNVYKNVKTELASKKAAEEVRVKAALAEREKEKEKLKKEREQDTGWFSFMKSSKPSTSKEEIAKVSEERQEQWKGIESDFGIAEGDEEIPDLTDLPAEYEWLKVIVQVPTVSVKLILIDEFDESNLNIGDSKSATATSTTRRRITSDFVAPCITELAGTSMSYIKYNRAGSLAVKINSKELSVTNPTTSRSHLPRIVYVHSSSSATSSTSATTTTTTTQEDLDLLKVTADLKPLQNEIKDTTLDVDVSCQLQPLHVVVDPVLLTKLGHFFAVPSKAKLVTDTLGRSAMAAAASEASKVAATQLMHQVTDTLGEQQTMRIQIDAAAPVVFVPFSVAQLSPETPMLCASLGHFKLDSEPPTDAVKKRRTEEISKAVASNTISKLSKEILFERYNANMKGIAVAYCSQWSHREIFLKEREDMIIAAQSTTSFFFLPPILLTCQLCQPLVPGLEESVPPLLIDASSESLHVRVANDATDLVITKLAKPWLSLLQKDEQEHAASSDNVDTMAFSPKAGGEGEMSPRSLDTFSSMGGGNDVQTTDFLVFDEVAARMQAQDELINAPLKHSMKINFAAKGLCVELVDDQKQHHQKQKATAGEPRFVLKAAPIQLDLGMTNKSLAAEFQLAAFCLYDTQHNTAGCHMIPAVGLNIKFGQDQVKNEMNIHIDFTEELQLSICQPLVDTTERALSLLAVLAKLNPSDDDDENENENEEEFLKQQQQMIDDDSISGKQQQQKHSQQKLESSEESGFEPEPSTMNVFLKAPAVAVALLGPQYSEKTCFRMAIENINVVYQTEKVVDDQQEVSSSSPKKLHFVASSPNENDNKNDIKKEDDNNNKQKQKIQLSISNMSLHDSMNDIPILTSHYSEVTTGSQEEETTTTFSSPTHNTKWLQVGLEISPDGKQTDIDIKLTCIHTVIFSPSIVALVSYGTSANGIVASFLGVFSNKASDLAQISVASANVSASTTAATTPANSSSSVPSPQSSPGRGSPSNTNKNAAAAAKAIATVSSLEEKEEKQKEEKPDDDELDVEDDDSVLSLKVHLTSVSVSLLGKSDRSPIFALSLNNANADLALSEIIEKSHIKFTAAALNLRDSRTQKTLYPNLIYTTSASSSSNSSDSKKENFIDFAKVPVAVVSSSSSANSNNNNNNKVEFKEEIILKINQMVVVYTPVIISYIVGEVQAVIDAVTSADVSNAINAMTMQYQEAADETAFGIENAVAKNTELRQKLIQQEQQLEQQEEEKEKEQKEKEEQQHHHKKKSETKQEQKQASSFSEENNNNNNTKNDNNPLKLTIEMQSLLIKAAISPESENYVEITPGNLSVKNEIIVVPQNNPSGPSLENSAACCEKISVNMIGTQIVVFGQRIMNFNNEKIYCSVTRKICEISSSSENTENENSSEEANVQTNKSFCSSGSQQLSDMEVELELNAPISLDLSKEQYEFILKLGGDSLRAGEQLQIPESKVNDIVVMSAENSTIGEPTPHSNQQQNTNTGTSNQSFTTRHRAATNKSFASNASITTIQQQQKKEDEKKKQEQEESAAAAATSVRIRLFVKTIDIKLLHQFHIGISDIKVNQHQFPNALNKTMETELRVQVGTVFMMCGDENADVLRLQAGTALKMKNKTSISHSSSSRNQQQPENSSSSNIKQSIHQTRKKIDNSELTIDVPQIVVHAHALTIRSVMKDVVEPANRLLLHVQTPTPIILLNEQHRHILEKDVTIDPIHYLRATSEHTGLIHFCLDLNGHSLTLAPGCFARGSAPSAEMLVVLDHNCMVEVRNGTIRVPQGYSFHSWISFASGSKILVDAATITISEMPWKQTSMMSNMLAGATKNKKQQNLYAKSFATTASAAAALHSQHQHKQHGDQHSQDEHGKTSNLRSRTRALTKSSGRWGKATSFARAAAMSQLQQQLEEQELLKEQKVVEEHEIHQSITVSVAELRFIAHSEDEISSSSSNTTNNDQHQHHSHSTSSSGGALPLQQLSLETVTVSLTQNSEAESGRPLLRRINLLSPKFQSIGNEDGGNCIELLPVSLSFQLEGTDHQNVVVMIPNFQAATRISRAMILVDELNELIRAVAPPAVTYKSKSKSRKKKITSTSSNKGSRENLDHIFGPDTNNNNDNDNNMMIDQQEQDEEDEDDDDDDEYNEEDLPPAPTLSVAEQSVVVASRRTVGFAGGASKNQQQQMTNASNSNLPSPISDTNQTTTTINNQQSQSNQFSPWAASSMNVTINLPNANILFIGVVNNSFAEVQISKCGVSVEVAPTFSVSAQLQLQCSVFNPTPAAWERILEDTHVGFKLSTADGENALNINTGSLDMLMTPGLFHALLNLTGSELDSNSNDNNSDDNNNNKDNNNDGDGDQKNQNINKKKKSEKKKKKNTHSHNIESTIEIVNFTGDDIKLDDDYVVPKKTSAQYDKKQAEERRMKNSSSVSASASSEQQKHSSSTTTTTTKLGMNILAVQFVRPTYNDPLSLSLARNSVSWLGEHIAKLEVIEEIVPVTSGNSSGNSLPVFASATSSSNNNTETKTMKRTKRILKIFPVHRRGTETIISIKSCVSDVDCKLLGVGNLLAGHSLFLETFIDLETHFILQPTKHRALSGVFPPTDTEHDVFPLSFKRILDGFSCPISSKNVSHSCYFRIESKHKGMVLGIPHFEIQILGGLSLSNDLPWPMNVSWTTSSGAGSSVDIAPHNTAQLTMLRGSDHFPLAIKVTDLSSDNNRLFISKFQTFNYDSDAGENDFSRCVLQEYLSASPQEMSVRAIVKEAEIRFYTPFIVCNNTSFPLTLVGSYDQTPQKRNYHTARPRRPSGICIDPLPGITAAEKSSDNENELFLFLSCFGDMQTMVAVPLHAVGTAGVFSLHSAESDEVFHLCFNTFFADQVRMQTRTIVITPRWVVVNRLPFPIRLGQDVVTDRPVVKNQSILQQPKTNAKQSHDELVWSPQHEKKLGTCEATEAYSWSIACTMSDAKKMKMKQQQQQQQTSSPSATSENGNSENGMKASFIAVVVKDDESSSSSSNNNTPQSSSTNLCSSSQQQNKWQICGKSTSSFMIDSSSTTSLLIPSLSNPAELVSAEAEVVKEGYYVYVTLRLPRQPPVLVVNRLPCPIFVEDRELPYSQVVVSPFTQKGVLTLAPTPSSSSSSSEEKSSPTQKQKESTTNSSSDNWLIDLQLPSSFFATATTTTSTSSTGGSDSAAATSCSNQKAKLSMSTYALDLFAGFSHEASEAAAAENSPSSASAASSEKSPTSPSSSPNIANFGAQGSPASPLTPPHASSPVVISPTTAVQLILTRGVGGQRIVTIIPKPSLDDNIALSSPNNLKNIISSQNQSTNQTNSPLSPTNSRFIELCEPPPLDFNLQVLVPSIALSLSYRATEIARINIGTINAIIKRQGLDELYSLTVKSLQIENMIENRAVYEIALFSFCKNDKPAILFEVKKKTNTVPRFMDITSFTVDIQPLIIQVGDRFLMGFKRMLDAIVSPPQSRNSDNKSSSYFYYVRAPSPKELFKQAPQNAATSFMEMMLVVDDLFIQPVAIRIWFKRQRDADVVEAFGGSGLISLLALNLEDVGILADGVAIHSRQETAAQMIRYLGDMYVDKLLIKLLGLGMQYLGSVPLLGAPAKFLHTVGKGVTKFVVDPITDVKSKKERAAAFAKGGVQMVGGVIGGAVGLVSDVAKGSAKVLNVAGGTKQDDTSRSKVPGLLTGLFKGVTGIITKPMEGASNKGVKGFFVGFAQGIAGVVTDPLAGVLTDVSRMTGKMAAILTDTEIPELRRSRMPRGFTATGAAVKPDRILEIFQYERFSNGRWNNGFGPSELGPWRNRNGKETSKPKIEKEYLQQLHFLLSSTQILPTLNVVPSTSTSSQKQIQQQQQTTNKHVDPNSKNAAAASASATSNNMSFATQQHQPPHKQGSSAGYVGQPPSVFASLWSIDRYSTNFTGWQYGKDDKSAFVTTQSKKRILRRRRWVVTLPSGEVSVSLSGSGSSSCSIRAHVMGSQQKSGFGGTQDTSHLFMTPVPRRVPDMGVASVWPPPLGVTAWVVEIMENERHYVFGWGQTAESMFGDPPDISSRDGVKLPKREDSMYKVMPPGFEWKTKDWVKLDMRYGFSFGTDDKDWTIDRNAKACRRTVYRRVLAVDPSSSDKIVATASKK